MKDLSKVKALIQELSAAVEACEGKAMAEKDEDGEEIASAAPESDDDDAAEKSLRMKLSKYKV